MLELVVFDRTKVVYNATWSCSDAPNHMTKRVFHVGSIRPPILGDPGAVSRAERKGATKVFKHERKNPWVPTLIGPFPNGQANADSWLGTKYALYYWTQSANSFSWVLFVSSYTTAIVSPDFPTSSPSLFVQGKLSFSTFLTRNEGTTDESKKRFGCYQQEQFNLPWKYSKFVLTHHNVL